MGDLFALMQNHKTTKIIRHYLDVHSLFQIVYFTNIAVNLFCISSISESFMNLKIHQSLFSLLVTLCYPKNNTWFSYRRTDWPTVACNQYLHSAQTDGNIFLYHIEIKTSAYSHLVGDFACTRCQTLCVKFETDLIIQPEEGFFHPQTTWSHYIISGLNYYMNTAPQYQLPITCQFQQI